MDLTNVIQNSGPLPITCSFKVTTNNQAFFVSGTAWPQSSSGGMVEMEVIIDNETEGLLKVYGNDNGHHYTFPLCTFTEHLSPGIHTITLKADTGTTSDGNDNYIVSMLEY